MSLERHSRHHLKSEIRNQESQIELTLSGAVMGSPSYMPPEQAAGKHDAVRVWSDVYSLGAVLYHLLTGRPPFQAASPVETFRQVIDSEPASPHSLNPMVPRDLETVCLKCLQKDPARRYASARELAEDLDRFLNHEPISARGTSVWERGQKWMRRRPAIAALSVIVAALVVLVVVVTNFGYFQTTRALKDSTWHLYLAQIQLAHQAAQGNEDGRVGALLDKWFPELGGRDQRGWEWYYVRANCRNLVSLAGPEYKDTFLERLNRLGRTATFDPRASRIQSVSWSSDGRTLAHGVIEMLPSTSGGPDPRRYVIRITDVETGTFQSRLSEHQSQIETVSWDPRGERLASGSRDGTVIVWDVMTGKRLATLQGTTTYLHSLACSPDGSRLATNSRGGVVEIWNSALDEKLLSIQAHDKTTLSFAWSPHGDRLASGGLDLTVRFWKTESGQEDQIMR